MTTMSSRIRVRAALFRELARIPAKSGRDVSELAEDALHQFVRSHRETAHLTSAKTNLRRLRSAHAEIKAQMTRLKKERPPDRKSLHFPGRGGEI